MIVFIEIFPVIVFIALIVMTILLRKKKNPEKLAVFFSVFALVCGIVHIFCEFYPFEYTGESGIDYIGQALIWGLFVNAILYTTLAAYVGFAIAATFFAVKAIKNKETRKKGIIALILGWICGLVISGLILTNIFSDYSNKKNIQVEVTEVSLTKSTDGEPAVRVELELYNGSKKEISYLSSVYEEVTQDGKELSHAPLFENINDDDPDIQFLEPGQSITIVKGYELEDPDDSVNILCRSYDGRFIYVDDEFEVER
ncbi:MAG: DUF5067 domain-containing protein [Saccharofermentans sp.]|nr:DUF5067 domain-containing protein [Saccharofermentans sp.]